MKTVLAMGAAIVGFVLLVLAVLYGLRMFSSVASPVTVIEPEPGIHCAKLITTDGAAISCWPAPPPDQQQEGGS